MQLRSVCVVTGSRAEYHLLYPLIVGLKDDSDVELRLVVTGSHLHSAFGKTISFIERDGLEISEQIPILEDDSSRNGIERSFARAVIAFGEYFEENPCDLLVILGDRYEMLAVAFSALNHKIPIAHVHGGELTEGALDDAFRHAITKMSTLHFVACEAYRHRVIQLGESPERVYNVGALGLESIRLLKKLSCEELARTIGFDFNHPCALLTYHPTTCGEFDANEEIGVLLSALDAFPDLRILCTKANADAGGRIINQRIEEWINGRPGSKLVSSLGATNYLNALACVDVCIGNSSSGIIEAPSFGLPVVNIGKRQQGRVRSSNIVDCDCTEASIQTALAVALSDEFRTKTRASANPYGDGNVSEKIIHKIKKCLRADDWRPNKAFYDIEFTE